MATRSGKPVRRIGILTCGGDCPGLNAVIRAVAKPAMTTSTVSPHKIEVYGFLDAMRGLVFGNYVKLTDKMVTGILTLGGTILGTSNKDNPFEMPVKKGKKMTKVDMSRRCVANYKKLKLDALVVIGGDGTMAMAYKLAKMGINIVGVPKTIDNDLHATDTTFGFDTAVNTATEAIDKLHTTAESHHRAMVIEIMGRYAGWLTLHAGLAGGADIILLPEFPYELSQVLAKIKERKKEGKLFNIIAISEGARPKGGDMVVDRVVPESHDAIRLGGIGKKLANDIEQTLGIEARVCQLGHVQRGGSPSPRDRIFSTRFGIAALDLVVRRRFGRMACYKHGQITSTTLKEATKALRLVKKDDPLIRVGLGMGISFGSRELLSCTGKNCGVCM